MARTLDEIIAQMDAEQSLQSDLNGLTSTSQTSIYKLWKYIIAVCILVFEKLVDTKKDEIQKIVSTARIPTLQWVIEKAYEFQYDSTTPQIMTLVNGVPTYQLVDTSKRIITRASSRDSVGVCTLLVAKSEPPAKLSTPELNSIRAYFQDGGSSSSLAVGLGWAGQSIAVYSLDPDLMFLEGTIYYTGQYAATIQNDCITAIENFLSYTGANFRTTDLIDALQSVPGFKDLLITNLSWRDAATPFGSGTSLISAGTITLTDIDTTAGYAIGETTVGNTLADKLTFTSI